MLICFWLYPNLTDGLVQCTFLWAILTFFNSYICHNSSILIPIFLCQLFNYSFKHLLTDTLWLKIGGKLYKSVNVGARMLKFGMWDLRTTSEISGLLPLSYAHLFTYLTGLLLLNILVNWDRSSNIDARILKFVCSIFGQ